MLPPISISGPHGAGKTTLAKLLRARYPKRFIRNDFQLDFATTLPTLSLMTHFERDLFRLYHRIFRSQHASLLARRHARAFILTDRSVYDSLAYIGADRSLRLISVAEHQMLRSALASHLALERPYTIVLNPPLSVILKRLQKRKIAGARRQRDTIFATEDDPSFLRRLRHQFRWLRGQPHIFYLERDDERAVDAVVAWAEQIRRRARH